MSKPQDLFDIAESGDAEGLRDKLRYTALTNLYFMAKVVLGYKELSPRLHQEFCDYIIGTRQQRRRGALIPRGHFKSTIVSKSYPLWRLVPIDESLLANYPDLVDWMPFHNPNHRVVIIGESADVGSKNLKDIKWNIVNNQMLAWLFPEIIPSDLNNTIWREDEILLPRSRSFDESSITTLGVGAKTTGKHWDIIIYDDLVGEKAAKSEAEMEAAKTWFKFAPGLANDPNTVEELFIGTRWKAGTADLYGHVMATLPSEEDEVESSEAIDHSSGERVGGFTWYIRSAIEPNPDTQEPEPIFPERFSLATLQAIRKREGEYAFSCNYLNDPTAEGVSDFDSRWLKEYRVSEDGKYLVPLDGTSQVMLGYLNRIAFYDPSSGGRAAKCEGAMGAIGTDSMNRKFLLDEWAKNATYGQAVEQMYLWNDRYHFYKIFFEDVGAQKEVLTIIELRNRMLRLGKSCHICGANHRPIKAEGFKLPKGASEVHKEDRIRAFLQEPCESGRLYVRQNSHRKFRTQFAQFPHGGLVDVLDAVASGVKACPAPRDYEAVREERSREKSLQMVGKPRTNTLVDYGGY